MERSLKVVDDEDLRPVWNAPNLDLGELPRSLEEGLFPFPTADGIIQMLVTIEAVGGRGLKGVDAIGEITRTRSHSARMLGAISCVGVWV